VAVALSQATSQPQYDDLHLCGVQGCQDVLDTVATDAWLAPENWGAFADEFQKALDLNLRELPRASPPPQTSANPRAPACRRRSLSRVTSLPRPQALGKQLPRPKRARAGRITGGRPSWIESRLQCTVLIVGGNP
jgi:hypothetical protein